MKQKIICLLFTLLPLLAFAQKESQAKEVLDKTSEAFLKAGGVKAEFNIKTFSKIGATADKSNGTILLKGNQFMLTTNGTITWFDGKTQWSYLIMSDEVNISTPTAEEVQSMNPYTFLGIYQKGFNYEYNGVKSIDGKQGYEVVLTPQNKNSELAKITLLISKANYQPLRILLEQKSNGKSEIAITNYLTKQSYSDSQFRFNKKNHPEAEIIDLR